MTNFIPTTYIEVSPQDIEDAGAIDFADYVAKQAESQGLPVDRGPEMPYGSTHIGLSEEGRQAFRASIRPVIARMYETGFNLGD